VTNGDAVSADRYDCIVVGAGHNGLVAAWYLAHAGLRVVVVERREIVGGACVTEEFAPGFRASLGAYVLSMLRASIWRDLRLEARGVHVDEAGPSLHLFDDDAALLLPDDVALAAAEIGRFSKADARALVRFEDDLAAMARAIAPLFDWTPPNLGAPGSRDAGVLARLALRGGRFRGTTTDLAYIFATSASQYLAERFESEHVRASLGWHAINDSSAGPATPGTAFVLLHDHAAEEAGGGIRRWGFVRGGMGRVTEAMAEAAREAGAEVRTGAPVERILVSGGRVDGVELADGSVLRSAIVASNADPKRTFLQLVDSSELPDEFLRRIRAYRCEGVSMKINLALAELPRASFDHGTGIEPYHRGLIQLTAPLDRLDLDQARARQGIPALEPHIELCIPTVHDPSLAPFGRHILTVDVLSQPFTLASSSWDAISDEVADRAIARIGRHFPNVPGAILHRQVLSPLDLERTLGLTGGHALHGEMAADQLFSLRPVRGYGDYRTPVAGLYMCGAGTHPGGGVNGANGRNCAREIVHDEHRRRGGPTSRLGLRRRVERKANVG
jgi:phytoene dehydrogenase-like protein